MVSARLGLPTPLSVAELPVTLLAAVVRTVGADGVVNELTGKVFYNALQADPYSTCGRHENGYWLRQSKSAGAEFLFAIARSLRDSNAQQR